MATKEKKEVVVSEKDNNDKLKKCFVITPIGDENTDIRRQIDGIIDECIRPVLTDFEIFVSHRICSTGSINNQILSHIYNDDLVIANLTNLNPNVMYELAFRHSIQKPVIVIKNKNDGYNLPFDIKDDRTIFYSNDIMGSRELKNTLKEFLIEINYEERADNPIVRAVGDLKARESFEKNKDTNEDEQNVTSYLLQRLTEIEDKIDNLKVAKESNNVKTVEKTNEYYEYYRYQFEKLKQKVIDCNRDDIESFRALQREFSLKISEYNYTSALLTSKQNNLISRQIGEISNIFNSK